MPALEPPLETITTEAAAYFLGFVAVCGRLDENQLLLKQAPPEPVFRLILEPLQPLDLRALGGIKKYRYCVQSPELGTNLRRWLQADDPKAYRLPALSSDALTFAFVRGCFDVCGEIAGKLEPRCRLALKSQQLQTDILKLFPAAYRVDPELEWRGNNALDVLGSLYSGAQVYEQGNLQRFIKWSHFVAPPPETARIRFQRLVPEAIAPLKRRATDSGYDLTLIRRASQQGLVTFYGTGLTLQPPFGWYLDVVPRSSIVKLGFAMANSVGVIDRGYRGEVLVPLFKVDASAQDLDLPCRAVQIVPRPIVHFELEERTALSDSARGEGGFGSTGD